MSARFGYRALIVDNENIAHRLGNLLTRPDINNRVIQTVTYADTLPDAYAQAEHSDFIYIDPFYFGLPEAVRFIAEVLSHWPVKAITLFRSAHMWTDRQRDLEGLAIPPAKLRTMLQLDKEALNDPANTQTLRANLTTMEREFQQELQRSGFAPDASAARPYGAEFGNPGPFGGYRFGGMMDIGVTSMAGVPFMAGGNPMQLQQIIEAAIAQAMRQSGVTQTHPIQTGLLPAPEITQWQQVIPQLQQALPQLQQQVEASKQAQAKLQEQLAALQREQRDIVRTAGTTEQRVHDVETRQNKLEQLGNSLSAGHRLAQILAIIALVVAALAAIAVPVLLLTRH